MEGGAKLESDHQMIAFRVKLCVPSSVFLFHNSYLEYCFHTVDTVAKLVVCVRACVRACVCFQISFTLMWFYSCDWFCCCDRVPPFSPKKSTCSRRRVSKAWRRCWIQFPASTGMCSVILPPPVPSLVLITGLPCWTWQRRWKAMPRMRKKKFGFLVMVCHWRVTLLPAVQTWKRLVGP